MQQVITTIGQERLANSVALNNNRKLKILGFRSGSGGAVSEDVTAMRARQSLVGTNYPSTGYYELTEELPIADTVNPGNWFIQYGLQLNAEDVSVTYEASEIGLFAKEYAVAPTWVSGSTYLGTDTSPGQEDFVSYEGSYYKCIVSNTASLLTNPTNTSYWSVLTVLDPDNLPLVPVPSTMSDPNPFLYYYIVRASEPLLVTNTHTTLYRIKIGLSQTQSDSIVPTFVAEDCVGFSETELSYLETITDQANATRELAMEVEALRASIP